MKLLIIIKIQKPKVALSNRMEAALNAVKHIGAERKPIKSRQIANDNYRTARGNGIRVLLLCLVLYSSVIPAQARSTTVETETNTTVRVSDMVCFQNGQKIAEETGLRNLMFGNDMIHGERADGKRVTMLGVRGDTATICKLVEEMRPIRP